MYSLQYKVTTSTCDSEGRLKLYSALQMMQDCSEMWIDSQPEVREYFERENMAQLLASRQVEIVRVPAYKEKLTVTTSVYDMKPMFGFRNTFIYDERGNPCYRTWSMGAFDYKDRRIAVPADEGTVCTPVRVMRADIDYNRHVNNANYIRMAMELIPEGAEIKGLRVEYRVAAKLGNILSPTLHVIGNGYIVTLAVDKEICAIVEFECTY